MSAATFKDDLESFFSYLQSEKRYSPHTVLAYRRDLNHLEICLALDVDENQQAKDLTKMDELETKIDLAKAYIDMGDDDAAKNIAQEVLDKGNEVQKQSAEEVLRKLK